jgi:hypothetical protein
MNLIVPFERPMLLGGKLLEALRQHGGATGIPRDDENRVIARDRASGLWQMRPVDRQGQRLRLTDTGPQDNELLDALYPLQVLTRGALERRPRGGRRGGVGRGPSIRTISRLLDQAQLRDVPRDRRLRGAEAAPAQSTPELLLVVERLAVDQFENDSLSARLHACNE